MTDKTFTVTTAFKLSLLTNAIVGALEGGSGYWLRHMDYETSVIASKYDSPAYSDEDFWVEGGKVRFDFDDPNSEEGKQANKTVSLEELRAGATIMAEKYGRHFGDLISENDDADTHDVFMQCVILGEVIYG